MQLTPFIGSGLTQAQFGMPHIPIQACLNRNAGSAITSIHRSRLVPNALQTAQNFPEKSSIACAALAVRGGSSIPLSLLALPNHHNESGGRVASHQLLHMTAPSGSGGDSGGDNDDSDDRSDVTRKSRIGTDLKDLEPKQSGWQKSVTSGLASAFTAGAGHPFSSAINSAMADGLRPFRISDLTYRGFNANIMRVFIKWSALDAVNQLIYRGLKHVAVHTPLKDRDDLVTGIAAGLTAMTVAMMLCPVERIRQHQILHGGSLINGALTMMREGGTGAFFKGALTSGINTLPYLIIRVISERVGGSDKAKVKKTAERYSMMFAPVRTYLTAVKQVQQTHGTAAAKAYMDTLMAAVNDPRKLLLHIAVGMIFVRVANDVYYFAQYGLENRINNGRTSTTSTTSGSSVLAQNDKKEQKNT